MTVESFPVPVIPSLRVNFSWTLVGNLIYFGCQWGMISVLAKLGNAALVGSFALGLAITAPVFMFTNLQLRCVQATDARSEFAFSDYFTLRVVASLTGMLAIVLLVLLGRYDRFTGTVILLVSVSKMIESLSDVIAGLLQKAERLDRVAISLMIKGMVSLSAFAMAFWITRSLVVALEALTAAWLSVLVLYDLRQASNLIRGTDSFFAFRWSRLKGLALLSTPMGIVSTLFCLNVNIPRYLLERARGQAELGIFASLAYLLVAINLIVNALGQSVTARLARHFANGEIVRFRNLLGRLLAFSGLILAVAAPTAHLIGKPLIAFVYRPEYSQYSSLFTIMVVTGGFSAVATFLNCGMTAARSLRLQVPIMIAMTACTVCLSFLLIPSFGPDGAAYALLIGSGVQVIGGAWALHNTIHRGGMI